MDDHNSRRPLTDAERQYFLDLWAQRENPKSPSRVTLEKKLAALHSQVDMARQLHELLTSPAPGGRTNLCGQHLGMQAEGAFRCNRHVAVCKRLADGEHAILEVLDNVGPAARVARNPCREAHDERLVRRIEEILFEKNGTIRFGAVPSLVTIEFPKPHTAQVYECPGCHEKLALDLRVRFRVKGIKLLEKVPAQDVHGFACPACGIVLQVKASRPITIRGQRRQIPVTLKNTDAFLRRAKGGLKEKKKRLLLAETQGTCVYCSKAIDTSSMRVDHIVPRSRGGPGVDTNLVAACEGCNDPKTGKGDRTPWEWSKLSDSWSTFQHRVGTLPLPLRKRDVLLYKDGDFPENPTALARAGARARQFIERLKEMLIRRGVPARQIADNYERGKLTIQTIDGWMTARLRRSWLTKADGSHNFPQKDDLDLHNHAQDAALVASCPPHTWREQIFRFGEFGDLAPVELAPEWKGFVQDLAEPLVRVLGDYRVSWKRSFADEKFSQDPRRLGDKRLLQYVPLREVAYSGTGPEKARHPSETFIVDNELDKRFRSVAASLPLRKKQTIPPEDLANHFPGIRHVKVSKQKGGELAIIRPHDGPPRKIQLKGASEAIVFWRRKGAPEAELQISVQWPKIFEKFDVPRHKPAIPEGAEILDTWERYAAVWLDQTTGHRPGFYRVKEFTDSKVTVLPENAVTDELATRMGLRKQPRRSAVSEGGPDEDAEALNERGPMREIVLGKADLLSYFTNKKRTIHAAGA